VFLAAVADKILAGGTLTDPTKLRALVGATQQSVVLDRDWDLLAFARQASGIAAGNLEFRTVPTLGTETNSRGSVVRVDPGQVRAFVEQRSAEREQAAQRAREAAAQTPATPTPAVPAPPPPLDVEAKRYVVHVRNGSGATGLAAQVQDRLVGLGFVRGTIDNATDTPTSVVRHRDSGDAAEAVAAQLGGFEVEQDDTVPSGHLQVVLGADARGRIPGLSAPAGSSTAASSTATSSTGTSSTAPSAPGTTTPAGEQTITAAGVPCVD